MNRWLAMALACGLTLQAVAAENAAADANLRLGVAYLQQGNLAIAKEKLERARGLSPNDVEVLTALGLLYARLGDNVKADSDFRSALRLAPKDPELANNYAVYLCGQGRTAEGVKRFEQAAADQLYASPWAAYTNAGVCLWGAKQLPEAEAQFRRALQLRPNYSEAVYQLAALELAQRKAAASAARVEAYVAGNLAQPEMLLLGWLSWCEVKDKVAALKMARRLQTQYPDAAETRAALKGCGNG